MVDADDNGKIRRACCGPTTKAVVAVEIKETIKIRLIIMMVNLGVDNLVFRPREGRACMAGDGKMNSVEET